MINVKNSMLNVSKWFSEIPSKLDLASKRYLYMYSLLSSSESSCLMSTAYADSIRQFSNDVANLDQLCKSTCVFVDGTTLPLIQESLTQIKKIKSIESQISPAC